MGAGRPARSRPFRRLLVSCCGYGFRNLAGNSRVVWGSPAFLLVVCDVALCVGAVSRGGVSCPERRSDASGSHARSKHSIEMGWTPLVLRCCLRGGVLGVAWPAITLATSRSAASTHQSFLVARVTRAAARHVRPSQIWRTGRADRQSWRSHRHRVLVLAAEGFKSLGAQPRLRELRSQAGCLLRGG